ncbi:hypothetical protein LTS18_008508, partial [Coniosporium uncinatum]
SRNEAADAKTSPFATSDGSPVTKRRRSSPAPTKKPSAHPSFPEKDKIRGLPPLLSPVTLPEPHGLPALLPVELPDNVEAELAKKHQRNDLGSPAVTENKAPSSHQKLFQSVGRVSVSDKPGKDRPPDSDEQSTLRPSQKKPVAGTATPETSVIIQKPSLVVKLKYGKKYRNDVERYLKLPPRLSKNVPSIKRKVVDEEDEGDQDAKAAPEKRKKHTDFDSQASKDSLRESTPRKNGSTTTLAQVQDKRTEDSNIESKTTTYKAIENKKVEDKKNQNKNAEDTQAEDKKRPVAEKRPRAEEPSFDGPGPKRQRASTLLEAEKRPSTPVGTSAPSPMVINRSGAQKTHTQLLTPKRNLGSVAMSRAASSDSTSNLTPSRPVSTPITSTKAPTSAPPSAPINPDSTHWDTTFNKYSELGRKIKHACQALEHKGRSATADDKKRAAVHAIESLLCYLLAYQAREQSLRGRNRPPDNEKTWATILPLWRWCKSPCAQFRHIDGLRNYVGATLHAKLLANVSERVEKGERSVSAGASAAESPVLVRAGDEKEGGLREVGAWYRGLQIASRDAASCLPIEEIIACYPKTWDGRAKDRPELHKFGGAAWDQLGRSAAFGDVSGRYALPIGVDSGPLQVVRFAIGVLGEWIEREGVKGYEVSLRM